MATRPKVSVIIPAYNHERYVGAAIESVLNQTLESFELIVVDDGSTDGTADIVAGYTDARVRLIRQENRGTAATLNRGLDLAQGEYVAILNSDDLYAPQRLATLILELENNIDAGLAFSRIRLIDSKEAVLTSGLEYEWLKRAYAKHEATGNMLLSLLWDNFVCSTSNFVFRRSLIRAVGKFSPLRYVNDLDFLFRVLSRYGHVFVLKSLLDYRIHATNTIKTRQECHAEFILELSWVIARALNDSLFLEKVKINDLFAELQDIFGPNINSILCFLILFRDMDSARQEVFLRPGKHREQLVATIDDGLRHSRYVCELEEARRYHGEKIEEFQGQIRNLQQESEAGKKEILALRDRTERILEARNYFSDELNRVLSSRTFQVGLLIQEARNLRRVPYVSKEFLKFILSPGQKMRIRKVIQRKHRYKDLLAPLLRNIRAWCRRVRRPVHYTQTRCQGPLVSVITPCYNDGQYIDQLLGCLKAQTFQDFEIIMVDDGSTDPVTREIMDRLEHEAVSKLHLIRQENCGVIAARNRAICLASGRYIFPLDVDDVIEPTFLEKCVLYLEQSPPHVFVYAWTYSTGVDDFIWKTRDTAPLEVLAENKIGFAVYHRQAFEEAGGYNPVMEDGYEDWEFCIHLVRLGYVGKTIPEPLYRYYVKKGSRNYHAVKKHGMLKKIINDLHYDSIHAGLNALQKKQKMRWKVHNPMVNILGGEQPQGDWYFLDLEHEKFQAGPVFRDLWRFANARPEIRILVPLAYKWRPFFDLNEISNLHVYFPAYYSPDYDPAPFTEYVKIKYAPKTLTLTDLSSSETFISESARTTIRILYLAPWLITGGADQMTVDWFTEISSEVCTKFLMLTEPSDNEWLYKIRGHAAEVYDLPALGVHTVQGTEEFILDFIRLKGIDVVHVMNSSKAFHALPAIKRRFPQVKIVAQFHCFDYLPDGRKAGYPMDVPMRWNEYIDYYNVVSHSLKDEILDLFPYISSKKFKVIYCCIDTSCYNADLVGEENPMNDFRQPDALNILFIGRLDVQKQPLRMARVAKELKTRNVPFVIHVLGGGSIDSQEGELYAYVKEHGLERMVCFHGFQARDRMIYWYAMGDLLLMTSDWEGIPVVLYEAMAMGLPCVAPDIGGIGELLGPDHGFLVTPKDNIEGYVQALQTLAENPDLLAKMGKRGRELVGERFDLSVMRRDYESFYRELPRPSKKS